MKIVLTTTLLVVLATSFLGINTSGSSNSNNIDNAFAQGDGMMGNNSGMMNATLAYAQDTGMMEGMNENMNMAMSSNQSKGNGTEMIDLNGTIDVKSTIGEAFKSKVTVNIIDAINTAQSNVGANSFVKEAELTDTHGYLVYKILVVDENMKKYKVIVDPGNGQVLMKKEVTWYDDHDKMTYGDDERYDKYGSSAHGYGDDYDQKKMMMKDKNY